jgi:putative ABC transport system substrate-binding protein
MLALVNAGNPGNQARLRAVEAAAASLKLQVTSSVIGKAADIPAAIAEAARQPNFGLIVTSGAPINDRRRVLFELAAHHRLPAVYPYGYFARDGGLMSYGPGTVDLWRGVASYVDRILRGERPGDLPVQESPKLELVVNLRAAKSIGLEVPSILLVRADEVIA